MIEFYSLSAYSFKFQYKLHVVSKIFIQQYMDTKLNNALT